MTRPFFIISTYINLLNIILRKRDTERERERERDKEINGISGGIKTSIRYKCFEFVFYGRAEKTVMNCLWSTIHNALVECACHNVTVFCISNVESNFEMCVCVCVRVRVCSRDCVRDLRQ